jgi:hypothetical protein
MKNKEKRFEVQGAGYIIISKSSSHRTGTARGFRTVATWYKYPDCGGVIDWKEALKMATYIYWRVILAIPSLLKKDKW